MYLLSLLILEKNKSHTWTSRFIPTAKATANVVTQSSTAQSTSDRLDWLLGTGAHAECDTQQTRVHVARARALGPGPKTASSQMSSRQRHVDQEGLDASSTGGEHQTGASTVRCVAMAGPSPHHCVVMHRSAQGPPTNHAAMVRVCGVMQQRNPCMVCRHTVTHPTGTH